MPGLLRGVARTAVVAGTATAVSGRVARRQAAKYADKDAAIAAEREQSYEQQMAAQQPPPQYAPPPQAYAPPPPAYEPPPPAYEPPPEAEEDPTVAKIKQLADLHAQGILTDEEFSAAKAKLLT